MSIKTEYKYTYFTQMDSTHWLCNTPDGIDLGEINYNLRHKCYTYDQPPGVVTNLIGLEELIAFMKQL